MIEEIFVFFLKGKLLQKTYQNFSEILSNQAKSVKSECSCDNIFSLKILFALKIISLPRQAFCLFIYTV